MSQCHSHSWSSGLCFSKESSQTRVHWRLASMYVPCSGDCQWHRANLHQWKLRACLRISQRGESTLSSPKPIETDEAGTGTRPADDARTEGGQDRVHKGRGGEYRSAQRLAYLDGSPNATLAALIKSREAPLSQEVWDLVKRVAASRSTRLPVITMQMMLRKDEARIGSTLSGTLCGPEEWRARLQFVARKGIPEELLDRWAWILSGDDGDSRIERFLSCSDHRPVFLLFQLLRRDETFQRAKSIALLLGYIQDRYVETRFKGDDSQGPGLVRHRSLDSGFNMTPTHFAALLRLLVHHCLRLWPSSLPAVARLSGRYIESIAPRNSKKGDAFSQRCYVFNYTLRLFQQKSPRNPVKEMKHNWQAQKILLSHSSGLDRPLVIDRHSYRAIRRVMLSLGKSEPEKVVAERLAKTWPPYRLEWDGLDERRRPEEDHSRSVKAGTLMRQAGYADLQFDRVR